MMVLGLIGLLCGGVLLLAALNWDKVLAMQPPEMRAQLPANASAGQLVIQPVVMLVLAIAFVALGVAVRGGGRGPIVTGIVLTGILLALCGLLVAGGGMLAASGNALGMGNICVGVVAGGVLLWQLLWLISPLRGSAQLRQMQAAYQAQYWQYMQQQHAYNAAAAAAYNQQAYNAPPAAAAPQPPGASHTGWQWSAPPPPPPPASGPAPADPNSQTQGGPHGQGPQ
jgi:hypothetical protein